MAKIFFKYEYIIRDLHFPHDKKMSFNYDGPHNVNVLLRAPSKEEQAIGFKFSSAFCLVSSEVEANPDVEDIFRKISNNQIIAKDIPDTEAALSYNTPEGLQIRLPRLLDFPNNFVDFIKNNTRELSDYAYRTVSVLRWRANEPGPHNPFGSRGLSWSFTGDFWHPAPRDLHIRVSGSSPLQIFDQLIPDVQKIVEGGGNGPIHHDLFREAWEQFTQNPRSALIIGIAAAEVSVKECIFILIPDTEWLVSNLPTPPIVQILTEYLPLLPIKNKINGKVKIPPPKIIDTLKKGVKLRNDLSHKGKGNITIDSVEEVLLAVQDVLWLMDYYSGYNWAFENISTDTKALLQAD